MDTRLGDITIGQLMEWAIAGGSFLILGLFIAYGIARFVYWFSKASKNSDYPDYRDEYQAQKRRRRGEAE